MKITTLLLTLDISFTGLTFINLARQRFTLLTSTLLAGLSTIFVAYQNSFEAPPQQAALIYKYGFDLIVNIIHTKIENFSVYNL